MGVNAERFWGKVEKTGGCWEWTGWRTANGYGGFAVDRRSSYAHRVSYELSVGPIPDGMVIDHLCRNRGCVNPAHLEAVTQSVNLKRGIGVGATGGDKHNAAKTHCPQGHEYAGRNLIEYQGRRYCRACSRLYSDRARKRRAEEKQHQRLPNFSA